jgi:hypothetical protein
VKKRLTADKGSRGWVLANVVGGVVILMVSALVPLAVARAALSLIMALMAYRDAEAKSDGPKFRNAETPAADPASAR